MIKRTKGEKIFNIINVFILSLVMLATLYPFYYTLIASFSTGEEIVAGNVILVPKGFTLEAYQLIPTIKNFFNAYLNTIYLTAGGVVFGLAAMSMGAYALSRPYLKGRRAVSLMISFTMWFSAGMIPFYLNIDSLNLVNSRMGVILAFLCTPFYIIILRSYFESLPADLEEAAKIDGLGNFGIFRKIMAPLAKPCLFTIGLYCAVDRWNGYFWSMILLKEEELAPVQVILKKIIVQNQAASAADGGLINMNRETLVYAIVIVVIIPIIAVYPFVQRYFIKGMTVGAVKG
ncbi:carbohydrate ABC transporter permease [Acutalibacter sp. 1XD8-36]|uniref:carbohydrate ABC transporter permease n=1 Tax=Acutalibacter sp. 1XD8-36 TaxID=2320852 RepID=UPI0026146D7F|nr:carbohydrate ABC transporter permease [Acutalibacter sp. 1XD8-36]